VAGTLHRYLIDGSHLPEADIIYSHMLHAAHQSGDLAAEAGALHGLGSIRMKKGHFRDAADYYRAALERKRKCGDREGEAQVLQNLGMTEFQLHNHPAAADYYRQAIAAY
jgi:tetratricopeptide (TPR) repeat protein